MLHKNSASPELLEIAQVLSNIPELDSFRIVGGTALALLIGHRKSIDIDFFSNIKVDKRNVIDILKEAFPESVFYRTQHNIRTAIKGVRVELYDDWHTPFRYDPEVHDGLRLASLHDIAAFKLDAIIERREKKDYIDLYFLFNHLGAKNVLNEFKEYNPHLSIKSILFALGEVNVAEENKSVMPEMLAALSWKEVKKTMLDAAKTFIAMQQKNKTNDTLKRQ